MSGEEPKARKNTSLPQIDPDRAGPQLRKAPNFLSKEVTTQLKLMDQIYICTHLERERERESERGCINSWNFWNQGTWTNSNYDMQLISRQRSVQNTCLLIRW